MARPGAFAVLIFAGAAGAPLYIAIGGNTDAQAPAPFPLQLEAKIPLGDVRGRIDHMAVDLLRQRLLVSELRQRHGRDHRSLGTPSHSHH
jgi:hypothetical protein